MKTHYRGCARLDAASEQPPRLVACTCAAIRQAVTRRMFLPTRTPDSTTSTLVGKQKWGPDVCGCRVCGFAPVRLELTRDEGHKEFAYTCPNVDCRNVWQSPARSAWKPSRAEAAEFWNAANDV